MERDKSKTNVIEEIFDKFSKRAYNIAYRFTGNYEDSRDLTQDAFVRVLMAVQSGNYNENLSTESYLYKIIHNIYIDGVRKKARTQTLSLDETFDGPDLETSAALQKTFFEQETALENKILNDNIQNALNQLPAKFRMPLILSDIEGFSYEEIGKILDYPIGTVRSRIHRGRKSLAKILKPLVGE